MGGGGGGGGGGGWGPKGTCYYKNNKNYFAPPNRNSLATGLPHWPNSGTWNSFGKTYFPEPIAIFRFD